MANWGGGAYCAQNYMTVLKCAGNGEVALPYGSKPYMGLGFLVFVTIIFVGESLNLNLTSNDP
jgi:hypothetical protein